VWQAGDVVRVRAFDPSGANPKLRPCIVVTADDEVGASNVGVAVTTRIENPSPAHHVRLPWHPGGQAGSGLIRECVAKCDWRIEFTDNEVHDRIGWLSAATMLQIMTQINALDAM
jgi:mRNA-degrading endonuclease toxin of MazEF toxin-antitoxin module